MSYEFHPVLRQERSHQPPTPGHLVIDKERLLFCHRWYKNNKMFRYRCAEVRTLGVMCSAGARVALVDLDGRGEVPVLVQYDRQHDCAANKARILVKEIKLKMKQLVQQNPFIPLKIAIKTVLDYYQNKLKTDLDLCSAVNKELAPVLVEDKKLRSNMLLKLQRIRKNMLGTKVLTEQRTYATNMIDAETYKSNIKDLEEDALKTFNQIKEVKCFTFDKSRSRQALAWLEKMKATQAKLPRCGTCTNRIRGEARQCQFCRRPVHASLHCLLQDGGSSICRTCRRSQDVAKQNQNTRNTQLQEEPVQFEFWPGKVSKNTGTERGNPGILVIDKKYKFRLYKAHRDYLSYRCSNSKARVLDHDYCSAKAKITKIWKKDGTLGYFVEKFDKEHACKILEEGELLAEEMRAKMKAIVRDGQFTKLLDAVRIVKAEYAARFAGSSLWPEILSRLGSSDTLANMVYRVRHQFHGRVEKKSSKRENTWGKAAPPTKVKYDKADVEVQQALETAGIETKPEQARPVRCPSCGKGFRPGKSAVQRCRSCGSVAHHRWSCLAAGEEADTYYCRQCRPVIKTRIKRDLSCRHCSYIAPKLSNLKRHNARIHKIVNDDFNALIEAAPQDPEPKPEFLNTSETFENSHNNPEEILESPIKVTFSNKPFEFETLEVVKNESLEDENKQNFVEEPTVKNKVVLIKEYSSDSEEVDPVSLTEKPDDVDDKSMAIEENPVSFEEKPASLASVVADAGLEPELLHLLEREDVTLELLVGLDREEMKRMAGELDITWGVRYRLELALQRYRAGLAH